MWRERAVALLREPLVHFLAIGALVFVVLSGRPPDAGERRIVVDEAVVSGIVNRYIQAFRRPPTPSELDGLIQDHVRSEVYYREALRLGLDQDDEVVRKRMRNKMLAIATAEAEAAQPTDADLQALLDKNPARYSAPPRYALEHRYLGNETPALRAAAAAQVAALKPGAEPTLPAVPNPLPIRFGDAPLSDLAAQFGDEFAAALADLPVGRWTGPVQSGFGLHLVRIDARRPAPPPSLELVRQRLENDWRTAAVQKAQDDHLAELLEGYQVVIEQPK
jgi:hypothetical protein